MAQFESRQANVKCTPEVFYRVVTDMRNFGRFLPESLSGKWAAELEKFSITLAPAGEIVIIISESVPFSSVSYSGTSTQVKNFSLTSVITENVNGLATVKLTVEADLNPFLLTLASGPVKDALGKLCSEMENIDDWESLVLK